MGNYAHLKNSMSKDFNPSLRKEVSDPCKKVVRELLYNAWKDDRMINGIKGKGQGSEEFWHEMEKLCKKHGMTLQEWIEWLYK